MPLYLYINIFTYKVDKELNKLQYLYKFFFDIKWKKLI